MQHKFWDKQPLGRAAPNVIEYIIEPKKAKESSKPEPIPLPKGYEWSSIDVNDPNDLQELYVFLLNNYLAEEGNQVKFDYSPEYIKWALSPPNHKKEWNLAVRASSNKKICGFISSVPISICVHGKSFEVFLANFLSIHKKLRGKRLVPILVREISRRCLNQSNRAGVVYTAGEILPNPLAITTYYHRKLDPIKLDKVGFSKMNSKVSKAATIRLYKLPNKTTQSFVPLEDNWEQCHELLHNYLQKFKATYQYTLDEFKHWFQNLPSIMNVYVKYTDGIITDLISFYSLKYHIKDDSMIAAYSFYNVHTTMLLSELMNNALILAKNSGHDVFNATDIMDNKSIFRELKFEEGTGKLRHYLYNFNCEYMQPEMIALCSI